MLSLSSIRREWRDAHGLHCLPPHSAPCGALWGLPPAQLTALPSVLADLGCSLQSSLGTSKLLAGVHFLGLPDRVPPISLGFGAIPHDTQSFLLEGSALRDHSCWTWGTLWGCCRLTVGRPCARPMPSGLSGWGTAQWVPSFPGCGASLVGTHHFCPPEPPHPRFLLGVPESEAQSDRSRENPG